MICDALFHPFQCMLVITPDLDHALVFVIPDVHTPGNLMGDRLEDHTVLPDNVPHQFGVDHTGNLEHVAVGRRVVLGGCGVASPSRFAILRGESRPRVGRSVERGLGRLHPSGGTSPGSVRVQRGVLYESHIGVVSCRKVVALTDRLSLRVL